MGCRRLTNVAPPGLCLFMLYHFRGFTPPATSFRPFGTWRKCGLTKGLRTRLALLLREDRLGKPSDYSMSQLLILTNQPSSVRSVSKGS